MPGSLHVMHPVHGSAMHGNALPLPGSAAHTQRQVTDAVSAGQ